MVITVSDRSSGGTEQATLSGDIADSERRFPPSTFLHCHECGEHVLRSRRDNHPHDLDGADAPTTAQKKILEEKIPDHALVDTQEFIVEFHDTYIERVKVEARDGHEAKQRADRIREFDGKLVETGLHVDQRSVSDASQATIEYLENEGLLPEDNDVTADDIEKLMAAKGADRND